jgi:hypothetical protein
VRIFDAFGRDRAVRTWPGRETEQMSTVVENEAERFDYHVPHHSHRDVNGGWLRPAVFGAMDGLVSNFALITGVAGGHAANKTRGPRGRCLLDGRR